jgi:hypothetical protein
MHTYMHTYIHMPRVMCVCVYVYILLRSKKDLLTIDIGIHSLKIEILSEAVTVEPATMAADTAVMAVTSVPVPLPKIERLLETPGNAGYIHTHTHTHTHTHITRGMCYVCLELSLCIVCVCARAGARDVCVCVRVCCVCLFVSLSLSLSYVMMYVPARNTLRSPVAALFSVSIWHA